MKKYLGISVVLILIFAALGCQSILKSTQEAKPSEEAVTVGSPAYPPRIIEHKNSASGEDIPEWVSFDCSKLEELPEYEDFYVFKFYQAGKELEDLNSWSRSLEVDAEIALMVSTRAIERFDAAELDGKEVVEHFISEVARILEAAEYVGTRKLSDYWVYEQTYNDEGLEDEKVYRFLLLYTVPRAQIHSAIGRAIRNEEQKKESMTAEQQAAIDWIKVLFSEEL